MRAAMTFDTLEYMDDLKRGGINPQDAEAITKATSKTFNRIMENMELATKKDLQELKIDIMKFTNENTWKMISILATFQTVIISVFGIIRYFVR